MHQLKSRKRPKSLITEKNLPKSPNQNHERCVTKSPNKSQQKSRNVAGVTFGPVRLRPMVLSTYQHNDVSRAFAFDIMSCSPTSNKCDKFCDYLCSTYRNYYFPSPFWAQVPSDARRTITDRSPFIDISMCCSLRHIIHYFWDEIVKQQTVTCITMNNLNAFAPINTFERRRQRLFRA